MKLLSSHDRYAIAVGLEIGCCLVAGVLIFQGVQAREPVLVICGAILAVLALWFMIERGVIASKDRDDP